MQAGERHVEHVLHPGSVPVKIGAPLRLFTGWWRLRSPSAGCPAASNQRVTPARSPIPAAGGRSSGSGQMRVSSGTRWAFPYSNANPSAFDGGEVGCWSIAGTRSSRVNDEPLHDCCRWQLEQPTAKPQTTRRQVRLSLQPTDEAGRSSSTTVCRTWSRHSVCQGIRIGHHVRQVIDEGRPARQASMRRPRSASSAMQRFQQQRGHLLVLEAAGAHERFVDGRQIVLLSSREARTASRSPSAEGVERARQQAFALKQPQQPLARELRMPSHTDGVTTAPASISSSAHAARMKCSSLKASAASPNDPVADSNTSRRNRRAMPAGGCSRRSCVSRSRSLL